MTLNLTRRLVKASELTASDHDGNLDKLENAIEALATVASTGAYADLSGQPILGTAAAAATGDFAPAAEGVTGGDAHDHSGGDGAQIAYSSLSGLPALGTAAASATEDFATAAQGALADTATQPGDLAAVATTGSYSDLTGQPTIGTAAAAATGDFAPAAEGVTNGDSHNHSGGDGAQIAYGSLSGLPTLGTASAAATGDFATAAQGALADTALQPDDWRGMKVRVLSSSGGVTPLSTDDGGFLVLASGYSGNITLPDTLSQNYAVTFCNDSGAARTVVAGGSATIKVMQAGTTGSFDVEADGTFTAVNIGSDAWRIIGAELT